MVFSKGEIVGVSPEVVEKIIALNLSISRRTLISQDLAPGILISTLAVPAQAHSIVALVTASGLASGGLRRAAVLTREFTQPLFATERSTWSPTQELKDRLMPPWIISTATPSFTPARKETPVHPPSSASDSGEGG